MRNTFFLAITILFSLGISSCTLSKNTPTRNIIYADTDPSRQRLDVYLPDEIDVPVTTIVILHGGLGNRKDHVPWAEHLVEQGYGVILPSYRIEPAQHSDGFCAVAWAHAHAEEYGFDTEHLFVIGWSSGGGIAAEIGMIDAGVDPFSDDECPYTPPETWVTGTILLAAGSEKWEESGWRTDMEPLTWLDGSEAPFLILHGELDDLIPVEDSEQLARALEDKNVPLQFQILEGADHFFPIPDNPGNIEAWQLVDDFLAEQVTGE